jgi:hypothetical protein
MRRKQEVVEAHRRLWGFGVSVCILRANRGRVEEACCRDCVAGEAEDVEGGEVYREAGGGLAEVVRDGLRVEGGTPGILTSVAGLYWPDRRPLTS